MQWVEGRTVERVAIAGFEAYGSPGAYQLDVVRLQKLAVILGLAAVCWAPIVPLALWLAR